MLYVTHTHFILLSAECFYNHGSTHLIEYLLPQNSATFQLSCKQLNNINKRTW